jgi:hypothetical protein
LLAQKKDVEFDPLWHADDKCEHSLRYSLELPGSGDVISSERLATLYFQRQTYESDERGVFTTIEVTSISGTESGVRFL